MHVYNVALPCILDKLQSQKHDEHQTRNFCWDIEALPSNSSGCCFTTSSAWRWQLPLPCSFTLVHYGTQDHHLLLRVLTATEVLASQRYYEGVWAYSGYYMTIPLSTCTNEEPTPGAVTNYQLISHSHFAEYQLQRVLREINVAHVRDWPIWSHIYRVVPFRSFRYLHFPKYRHTLTTRFLLAWTLLRRAKMSRLGLDEAL